MSEQVLEIAARIREMREICNMTAEQIAKKVGMSTEEYLRCENGEVDIPISFLTRIAPLFNIEVTSLITGNTPKLHGYALCRNGKGVQVHRMNRRYTYHSLAYSFKHKTVEPFSVTIDPDDPDAAIDLNTHDGQEFDYVLEGVMKLCIGSKEIIMTKGDSIYYDSSIPHGMKAIGGQVQFMALVIPPLTVICAPTIIQYSKE